MPARKYKDWMIVAFDCHGDGHVLDYRGPGFAKYVKAGMHVDKVERMSLSVPDHINFGIWVWRGEFKVTVNKFFREFGSTTDVDEEFVGEWKSPSHAEMEPLLKSRPRRTK